ncbi:MAG: polysaccharide biosynthesis C-terminal domain-containing protein [Ignavibacteria bacterium]|nr:polysaccharide biosynthesis C-terminal domain-containing protein [Ignavibacteria bacterium]
MNLILKSSETILYQGLSNLINLFSGVIIARALGPGGRGLYAVILMIHVLLSTIVSMGIGNANIYHIGKKKYSLNVIYNNSVFFTIVAGFSTIGLVYILSYGFQFEKLIGLPRVYFLSISWLVPFTLFFSYLNSIFLGLHKIKIFNAINLSKSILFLVSVVCLVMLLQLDQIGILISLFVTEISICILSVYFYFQVDRGGLKRIKWRPEIFKDSMIFGFKGHLGTAIQILNYRMDVFLLALFLVPEEIGYYAIAFGLVERILIIPNAISQIFLSASSSLNSNDSNHITPKVTRVTLFSVTILALIVFIFSKLIIKSLFGIAYLPGLKSLWILLPGMIFLSLYKVMSSSFTGQGRPEIASYAAFTALIVNISGNLILIPMIGIEGAALTSTLTYFVGAGFLIFIFCSKTHASLRELFFITREDINSIFNEFSGRNSLRRIY